MNDGVRSEISARPILEVPVQLKIEGVWCETKTMLKHEP
jgi:hypothetical protein